MNWQQHYSNQRIIPGRGLCGLSPKMFTTGLVVGLDELGYKGRYCYERRLDAKIALESWSGEGDPPGPWIKWKGEGGDRRNPKLNTNQ